MRVLLATAAIVCGLLAAGPAGAASATHSLGHRLPPPLRERAAAGAPVPTLGHRRHPFEFPAEGPCQGGFCWTPGEPVIAVGPTDILETVNTAATVYDKSTGTKLAEFDFGTFWDGSGTMSCVDPRALYMAGIDRFAFCKISLRKIEFSKQCYRSGLAPNDDSNEGVRRHYYRGRCRRTHVCPDCRPTGQESLVARSC